MRTALLLIAVLAPIVPRTRRRAWRQQWEAELIHHALWLGREGRGPARIGLALVTRTAGAVPHACTLRCLDWSPGMILQDLKFAWRMFARRPAFSAVAVLILALGIGANVTSPAWRWRTGRPDC